MQNRLFTPTPTPLDLIKQECTDRGLDWQKLQPKELEQLSWLINNPICTPEVGNNQPKINFEITREIIRRHCLNLVEKGNNDSYLAFVQLQDNPLSIEAFQKLSAEFNQLDELTKDCVRKSCFMTKSARADDHFKILNIEMPADSEEFLTKQAQLIACRTDELPITRDLSNERRQVFTKLFFGLHFRHLMFAEGHNGMLKNLREAVRANQINEDGLNIWRWRWLANLWSFNKVNQGSGCYNQDMHDLATQTFFHVKQVLSNPDYDYLKNFLSDRAHKLGLDASEYQLTDHEMEFIAHLAAMHNHFNITNPQKAAAVYLGYKKHTVNQAENIAEDYFHVRQKQHLPTATYVPAILNTAARILSREQGEADSISLASGFMCSVLASIYKLQLDPNLDDKDKNIVCMNISQEKNLEPILKNWLNNKSVDLTLDPDTQQLILSHNPTVRQTHRI